MHKYSGTGICRLALILKLVFALLTGLASSFPFISGSMSPETSTAPPGMPIKIMEQNVYVFDGVIKSKNDKCQYRYLTLANGLRALLVSEPNLDKAGAALDVHVGNFYDPKKIPGLAHFLEHLLFMGTEKYPDENAYGQFLSAHGGHSNAFTAEEHTNYFFDVSSEHLREALDRFAQFFVAPLFNPDGTGRELQAVDSENKKNLKNDHWRINQLMKSLSNPEHPYSHFGTGNIQTLGESPRELGLDIRKVLIKFYEEHYSANLMTLVVYGKNSLEELQEMVVEMFSKVVNRNISLKTWQGMPMSDEHFGKVIHVTTIKDLRTLYLMWQLPDLRQFNLKKPEHYFSHLLGHEGHGSILSQLKTKAWATNLGAGADTDSRGYAFFQISVDLTLEGLANYEEIIKMIFQYLHMLGKEGPQERIFKEMQNLENISFDFMEKGQPSSFAYRTAGHMKSFPPEFALKGPRVAMEYDADAIIFVLEHMNSNNFRVILAKSESLLQTSDAVQIEKWYGTEYFVEDFSENLVDFIKSPIPNPSFTLPKVNEFIPESLEVKQTAAVVPVMHPKLIFDNEQVKLWHKADDIFEVPKGCFQFLLVSALPFQDPFTFVRTYLFVELFRDSVNEMLYEAEVAGLSLEIGHTPTGIYMSFCGYDNKLSHLMEKVLVELRNFKVDDERFKAIKEKYHRWLKSVIHDTPYNLISYYLNGCQMGKYFWFWEKLQIIDDVEAHDIDSYAQELLNGEVNIMALCHGNFKEVDAKSMLEVLRSGLPPLKPVSNPENLQSPIIQLHPKQSIAFVPTSISNVNSAIEVLLQVGAMGDMRLRGMTMIFAQIFEEPFFDQLRTKEQLGYVVRLQLKEKGNSIGLGFVIQSEKDPLSLDDRIEDFLSNTLKYISDMREEEYLKHVRSLTNKLLTKKRRITDETRIYWNQMLLNQFDFERIYTTAAFLSSISKQDIAAFMQDRILADGPNRKKLAVHLWSESLEKEKVEACEEMRKRGRQVYDNINDLKAATTVFPLTYSIADVEAEAKRVL